MLYRLVASTLLVLASVQAYLNPIIPGFNPDPSILRTGDDYFVVTSTFEFFPGVPIYHSRDLIKWEVIGHALNRPSQLNMRGTAPSGGIFAPTLRYNKGTYYLITTWFDIISPPDNVTRTPRSMYVKTTDIFDENTWSDPIYVDQWGFDPNLFFDDDGKVLLSSTSGGAELFGQTDPGYFSIFTSQIDIKTGDALTTTQFSLSSALPLDTPRLVEGSHIYKLNGTYYMLTAEAGTDVVHREMAYRSTTPYGPWMTNPNNPLIFNGRNLSSPVLATGHADIVQTPQGDWWAVFLATRPQNPTNSSGFPQLGRETFLAPLKWVDGWPVINDGKEITTNMTGLYELQPPRVWKDSFKNSFADKAYYTQRTPYKAFHTFPNSGGISLRGNLYSLSDRETPAAFFRKQTSHSVIFSTHLSFSPTTPQHEAGLTVFLSNQFHNEIGVTIDPSTNQTAIFASTRTGTNADVSTVYRELPVGLGSGGVELFIKAEPHQYSLGYGASSTDAPNYIATVDNEWLQSFVPGWQNFVGAHFGFYASGNKLPMLQHAVFEYIQTTLL